MDEDETDDGGDAGGGGGSSRSRAAASDRRKGKRPVSVYNGFGLEGDGDSNDDAVDATNAFGDTFDFVSGNAVIEKASAGTSADGLTSTAVPAETCTDLEHGVSRIDSLAGINDDVFGFTDAATDDKEGGGGGGGGADADHETSQDPALTAASLSLSKLTARSAPPSEKISKQKQTQGQLAASVAPQELSTAATPLGAMLGNTYGASVEEALAKIVVDHSTIAKQFKECSTGSKTIPLGVIDVYKHQGLDAVGVLYGGLREAQKQLDDLNANPIRALGAAGKEAKAIWKKRTSDLKKAIAVFNFKLSHCHAMYCDKLKIPLDTTEAHLPTLTKGMPVAATSTGDSMQRLLGKLWLIDRSTAASGNKRLQQLVKKKLNTALSKYDAARNEATGIVVPLVLGDVVKYQDELDQILATGGSGGGPISDDVLRGLEELKDSIVPLTKAEAAAMTADPRAPDPFDPAYLVYSRLIASETSPVLYRQICKIIKDTGCNAIAVPGGVKGAERMVFKTFTNYAGDFTKCRDISRITVVVATMRDLLIIAQTLQRDEKIRTIRGKFRFSPDYDPVPTGGYRDTQYQVFVEVDGIWRYAEVQLNLHPFMMLKNQKDAGHGAFNKARAIAAYSDATLRFTGGPSPELWAKVAQGMLMYVSLNGSELSFQNMMGFLSAAFSPKCRLRKLSVEHCSVDRLSAEKDAGFPLNVIAPAVFAFDGVLLHLTSDGLIDWGSADNAKLLIDTAAGSSYRAAAADLLGLGDTVDLRNDKMDKSRIVEQTVFHDIVATDLREGGRNTGEGDAIGTAGAVVEQGLATNKTLKTLNGFDIAQLQDAQADLSSKEIDNDVAFAIGCFLATNKTLATLNLGRNKIGDAGAAAIGQRLATNKTLKALDLNHNAISDAGAAAIGQGLATNKTLVTLNLSGNSIGDAGAAAIGQGLATNKTLATLDLSWNYKIGDAGAAAIGRGLATNKTLVTLNLYLNRIGDAGAAAIGQGLATNKTLKALDLNHNAISDAGAAAIGQGLATNKTLATLNLGSNSISSSARTALKAAAPHVDMNFHV